MRRGLIAFAVLLAAPAVALALKGKSPEPFLDRYVEPDGRVVRHDQGGDTVSEGQAYAMLIAAAEGDERRFALVWRWTRTHLQRDDGTLAWRWARGRVADPQPAPDADLDAARALLVGARRFRETSYRAAGLRIARGVLRESTFERRGALLLAAGPWARAVGVVNPSYASPRAFRELGAATRDARWGRLAFSSRATIAALTARAPHLPPDWARAHRGAAVATGPPGKSEGARYGFDAVRVPIRLAESCARGDRALAARMWPALRSRPGDHPTALVAAAAAAAAAGDTTARDDLLDRADEADQDHPTYYGAAWAALGRAMLTTRDLGGC